MSFDHDKAREICRGCLTNGWNPMTAALAEIERLERENERLRKALLRIANGNFMGAKSLEIACAALEGRD